MLFNSLVFLFAFVPIVLFFYWVILRVEKARLWFMNFSSFVFYGAWSYQFLPLLIFSTYFDFKLAQKMEARPQGERKKYVFLSVLVNLGLLGFFKYFYFLTDSSYFLLDLVGFSFMKPQWDIVLPVGISFYTFQSMSYTIDVYRSHSKAYKDYKLFSSYVCFFPQLVAGPIVRHNELVEQIKASVQSRFNPDSFVLGIHYFTIGLAKKVLVADRLAAGIDPALYQLPYLTSFEALVCAIGYSFQIYFDFSGYSDMAIGLGYFFNLKFPFNFNSPYKSLSITEFWRRWHMTLSRWLRDYLYISLGGNRQGTLKTYRNLMLTMLLGGLWHGAGWNYVIWGGIHGAWLALERRLGGPLWRGPKLIQALCCFFLVTFAWIFFRSPDIDFAFSWLGKISEFSGGWRLEHFHPKAKDRFIAIFIFATILVFRKNSQERANLKDIGFPRMAFYAFLFFLSVTFMSTESPFLYFQF